MNQNEQDNKPILCDHHITRTAKNVLKTEYTEKCEAKAIYFVSYNSGIRTGDRVSEHVCQRHFRALNMRVERVRRLTGFDCGLSFEKLTT